jgi:hypothetical protein
LSHLELTASHRAKWILDHWSETISRFIKVFPHEFKRVLGVARAPQAYIPSQPVAVLAGAVLAQPEALHEHPQNGQVFHERVLNGQVLNG